MLFSFAFRVFIVFEDTIPCTIDELFDEQQFMGNNTVKIAMTVIRQTSRLFFLIDDLLSLFKDAIRLLNIKKSE